MYALAGTRKLSRLSPATPAAPEFTPSIWYGTGPNGKRSSRTPQLYVHSTSGCCYPVRVTEEHCEHAKRDLIAQAGFTTTEFGPKRSISTESHSL